MALVYRNFTQTELDTQYSPSRWVTRCTPLNAILTHVAHLEQGTKACERSSACVEKNVRYSDVHEACTLDLHHPQTILSGSPIVVYIHGGYWCAGVLEHSGAWMAETIISRTHCSVAAVEYGLCDRVSLDECVNHVRLAVLFLYKRYPLRPLIVIGHSAGGHLCAMLLATDWQQPPFSLTENEVPFKVCIPVSGIFDLEPIRLSCVNQESNLHLENDLDQVHRNSPMRLLSQAAHNCARGVKVAVVVGAADSPEFKRQSKEYHNALKSRTFREIPGEDHFSIVERLDDSSHELTQLLIRLVNEEGETSRAVEVNRPTYAPLFALGLFAVFALRWGQ